MTKKHIAKWIKLELEAIKQAPETDLTAVLTLINEALRNAEALADAVLTEKDLQEAA